MLHLLTQIEIFFFIFSILYVLKYVVKAAIVIRLEQGKIDNTPIDLILLGASLSYIITMLITGF